MNDKNIKTTEITTVRISEQHADELISDIQLLQDEVIGIANKNAVLISLKVCEALEQKVHFLKGFEDNTKGQCKFLETYFSYEDKKWGDTQRKMANIIAHNFGRRLPDSTEYEPVSPSVLLYGEANLWEISKFPDFDKDNFDDFVKKYDITPQTSKSRLKEKRQELLGQNNPTREDPNNEEPNNEEPKHEEPKQEELKQEEILTSLKQENDNLHAKVENVRDDIAKLYQLCLDKKTDDKKFRDESKKILSHLEKIYLNK